MIRSLLALIFPAALLAGAIFLGHHFPSIAANHAWLLELAPLGLLGVALGMAFRFNQVRVFFMGLGLLACFLVAGWVTGRPVLEQAMALLAPLAVWLLVLLPARGILTLRALPRYLVLAATAAAVLLWSIYAAPEQQAWLVWQWVPGRYLDWTPLSQPAVLAYALLGVVTLSYFIARPGIDSATLLGVLVALALIFHHGLASRQGLWLFSAVALMLILAILQATYRMAYIDELTDLPARRALRELLSRTGGTYTIAMLDVDHFKKFNDTYGHDVGDNVLRMIGSRLRDVTGGGKPFRYGGEEFTIVFSGKGRKEVKPHLDALRERIAATDFVVRRQDRRRSNRSRRRGRSGKSVQVTVSIGMAEPVEKGVDNWAVLKAADSALYKAKKQGRNRVCG